MAALFAYLDAKLALASFTLLRLRLSPDAVHTTGLAELTVEVLVAQTDDAVGVEKAAAVEAARNETVVALIVRRTDALVVGSQRCAVVALGQLAVQT